MDITDVILRQHAEQRRMFAMLEQFPRDDTEGLGALWTRLEIFLETHAEAEERYRYPELLRLGTGGGDAGREAGSVGGMVSRVRRYCEGGWEHGRLPGKRGRAMLRNAVHDALRSARSRSEEDGVELLPQVRVLAQLLI